MTGTRRRRRRTAPAPVTDAPPTGPAPTLPDAPPDALTAPVEEPEPEQEPDPAPEPAPSTPQPVPLDDTEWDAFVAAAPSEADFPFDPDEEVLAQRVDDDGDLIVVTSFGRKVGINPDGWMTVLTGPPLDVIVPAVPKPPRKSWKEPRG